MAPRLEQAVTTASEDGMLVVGAAGVALGDRVRADLAHFRSFVERHHRMRFGKAA